MKKTILIASVLSLFLTSNFTSASSLTEMIPSTTDLYFEFNTATTNPLQNYLITKIPNQFAEGLFPGTDEQKQKDNVSKAYKDILSSNTLSAGFIFPEENISVSLKITDTQYQNFINALGPKATTVPENSKIYSIKESNFYFTKTNDLFVFAPTKEELLTTLNDTSTHLNSNAAYKDVSSEFNTDDTLILYISGTILENIFKDNPKALEISKDITASLKALGLTLKKTSTGLNTKMITAFNPEKAKELGINISANNFTPLLYKSMPSENPIFYTEFSNLKSTIKTVLNLVGKTGKIDPAKLEIPAAADAFLSILENETAIYLQKDNQILPALTIVFNTSAHKDIATSITTTLTAALEEELKNKNIEYQQSTNKNLTTFTFDINKLDKSSQIPEGLNKFSVTLGTTPENYLLFSTYSKIASEYGQGLNKNSKFKDAFSNLNQTVSGISYINIENLATWYDQVLSSAEQTTNNEYTKKEIENTRNLLKAVKAPWHDMGIISKTTETHCITEINLNFDLEKIDLNYLTTIKDFGKSFDKSFKSFKNSRQTFNDTPADGWYYDDVKDLNARGIIKGYEDQSFKPEKNITRAEFLTMILRAFDNNNFENSNYADSSETPTTQFNDVNTNDWFSNAVRQGTNDRFISGYSDNSFHPNSPITRAEAVSILNKAIKFKLEGDINLPIREVSNPFSDVKPTDWYYEDVQEIYAYSFIDGDNNGKTFSPNRNINRAEASKIINKALKGIENMAK